MRFSVPEIPGKWLAFLLTGVAIAIWSLREEDEAGVVFTVVACLVGFVIAWSMALGAAYLANRYLHVSFGLACYIVYGVEMFLPWWMFHDDLG